MAKDNSELIDVNSDVKDRVMTLPLRFMNENR